MALAAGGPPVSAWYDIYGLALHSAESLPGLEPREDGMSGRAIQMPDVEVHLGARPPWADDATTATLHRELPEEGGDAQAPPVVVVDRLGRSGVRLAYAEGIRFHVASSLDRIWADWDAPLDEADAVSFLVGPVLGHVLRGRGVLALHASAVAVEGRLVGFVGPGGAGKSTLAASLAARGHAVLADDVLALRERDGAWWGAPANAPVRLWEASARRLFGAAHGLPSVSRAWEKRVLSLEGRGLRRQREAMPLYGVVLLDGDPAPEPAPAVIDARGHEALLSLVGNTYVSYLLADAERAHELEAVGRLAQDARVGRLRRPPDGGDVDAVAAAVERWARHGVT